jgi:DNA adenine methylase
MNTKTKPIIKWVGGKTKLLPYIIENLPNKEFKNYYEPFVGGASVIIELLSKDIEYKIVRKYNISDINKSLINVYNIVKTKLDDLIIELNNEKYTNLLNNYNINKTRFNEIKFDNENCIERAALFIYLNKCGFNGMFRENKSGEYNIPFGKMKNPKICDNITLNNFKTIMKDVNIACSRYQDILELTQKDDLVYLDPPYHDTFTGYTSNKFREDEQRELKLFVDKLTEKGVNVMVSNSATEFIKDLYKDYTIVNLTTKYSLGGKNADRGNKEEVLIKNFN